jgi:serine/threonine protein kinase
MRILWQIACGLSDIHKADIIHRDIKPNNIRVNSDSFVKIFDFGLSRSSGADAETRSVIGTPGFMAPELWSWGKVSFNKAIDIYAFGVLALSLFKIPLPKELLSQPPVQLFTGIPELSSLLPAEVASIIERCLSYDAEDRPQIDEIENILRVYLLRNQHRGLLVLGHSVHEINHKKSNITVNSGSNMSIGIKYDGLRFSVSSLLGNITVNNMPIQVGNLLPACCVITFTHDNNRTFVTFDVSNPEVMP